MILSEEYFKRHRIPLRVVPHTITNGSLVFRDDDPSSVAPWVILNVNWSDPGNHPGHFEIRVRLPKHDSYNSRDFFMPMTGTPPVLNINYEQYEKFIEGFVSSYSNKLHPITSREEMLQASWDIFLYCYDSFLLNRASCRLRTAIEKTIDGFEANQANYHHAVEILMKEQPSMFEKYDVLIHQHFRQPMTWLAEMMIAHKPKMICNA